MYLTVQESKQFEYDPSLGIWISNDAKKLYMKEEYKKQIT